LATRKAIPYLDGYQDSNWQSYCNKKSSVWCSELCIWTRDRLTILWFGELRQHLGSFVCEVHLPSYHRTDKSSIGIWSLVPGGHGSLKLSQQRGFHLPNRLQLQCVQGQCCTFLHDCVRDYIKKKYQ
jgi:hypothetical protein